MISILKSRRFWNSLLVVTGVLGGIYAISAVNYIARCSVPRTSCLEHRQLGCGIDGNYLIKTETISATVTCDMHTDGGGWTLLANYLHQMKKPGRPNPLPDGQFPLQNSTSLGSNEVDTPYWGHTSTSTRMKLNMKEIRFRCETTHHNRLIDFTLWGPDCLAYLKLGKGGCSDTPEDRKELVNFSRNLEGSSANLPAVAMSQWADQGDNTLTNYPFYLDYKYHWSVGPLPGRFECDDHDPGNTTSTFHQVWAR